jgi:hypothetical protein
LNIFLFFPDLSQCNEYCGDDNNHKIHSADSKGHLFESGSELSAGEKMNFKNDNNNNNNQSGESGHVKEKEEILPPRDESPSTRENHVNGNRNESPKTKQNDSKSSESPTPISQFLNSLINFRRDEMTLNLNNLLTGANQGSVTSLQQPVAANLLLNDLNRNFLSANFGGEHMNPALATLVASHQQYSKYGRGACKWPGCDMIFDDLQTFTK